MKKEVSGMTWKAASIAAIFFILYAAAVFSQSANETGDATDSKAEQKSEETQSSSKLTNTMCPVLTDEKVDPEVSIEYKGKRVYLCCTRCLKKFQDNPEKYIANLPQFTSVALSVSDATLENQSEEHHDEAEHHEEAEQAVQSGQQTSNGQALEHEQEEESHDHASASGGHSHSSSSILRFAGKFHPVIVHFPIALVLAAALAELLFLITKNVRMTQAARYCLALGALSAVVAAALGWANAATSRHPGMENYVEWHRLFGTIGAALAVATWIIREWAEKSKVPSRMTKYRIVLFLSAIIIGIAGHLGATLIYGSDYFFSG